MMHAVRVLPTTILKSPLPGVWLEMPCGPTGINRKASNWDFSADASPLIPDFAVLAPLAIPTKPCH